MGDSVPLAFFISFRTYGTWLHGDERGSVDRYRNDYGTEFLSEDQTWHSREERLRNHPSVILDQNQRDCVGSAIRELCKTRRWKLHALSVRTNHVHVVVTAGTGHPELVLNAFKAGGTRQLRQAGHWSHAYSPWSDKGSNRYLWSEASLYNAIDYVLNRQESARRQSRKARAGR